MAQKGTQIMGRARLSLSLHLVSLWRYITLRNLRKLRGVITSFLPAHSVICGRPGAGTSSCKVGPESGAHFLLYAPGANPSCFGVILGFMGCAHLSGQDCTLARKAEPKWSPQQQQEQEQQHFPCLELSAIAAAKKEEEGTKTKPK